MVGLNARRVSRERILSQRQLELLRMIEDAFRGVKLGDGVSLHQTIVIDHYGHNCEEAERQAKADERHDWRKLIDDPELLNVRGIGGMSFYDARGLRFHLPAYICAIVKYDWPMVTYEAGKPTLDLNPEKLAAFELIADVAGDVEFQLTHLSDYQRERFFILNEIQRQCVCAYLSYMRDITADYRFPDDDRIDQAIENYWSRPPDPQDGIPSVER